MEVEKRAGILWSVGDGLVGGGSSRIQTWSSPIQ